MPYFIRDMGPGHTVEVWRVDGEVAIDAHQPTGIAREFRARPGETPWDRMAQETPWLADGNPFHQTRLDMGEHNPRIARPLALAHADWGLWSPSLHSEPAVVAASRGQAEALLRQLQRICQTVQPGPATFAAYGHDIRNLMMLACMEVETHWRGVLVANGARRERFSTNDYVALAEVMGLRDYVVRFPAFPDLDPIRPFAGWGLGDRPTEDLPWYAAYNAVKHNREDEFAKANLGHAFQALTACAVMLAAQYGRWALGRQTDLSRFFSFVERPTWSFAEHYISGYGPSGTATHERFTATPHPVLAVIQDKPKTPKTPSTKA